MRPSRKQITQTLIKSSDRFPGSSNKQQTCIQSRMVRLTVLCVPVNAIGHTNAALGIGGELRKRGHRVVFAAERSHEGIFKNYGFEEEVFVEDPQVDEKAEIPEYNKRILQLAELMEDPEVEPNFEIPEYNKLALQLAEFMKKSSIECFYALVVGHNKMLEQAKYCNTRIAKIIKKCKPDVIIEDRLLPLPALVTAGIPLIKLCSMNPLYLLDNESLPPHFSGLALNDTSEWQNWREVTGKMFDGTLRKVDDWLQEMDSTIPKLDTSQRYKSTNLNILVYPKLLAEDYLKRCSLSDEFMRIDYCIRESNGDFEIPAQIKDGKGKLIYFSIGTLGSSIVFLMERLITILSKSNHRFIVSKGICHDKFELAENMWGESYLPQLDILPLVDLVITHGGNNTFCETLYFGKPMLILPLFGDQYDNAQRAVEKNIGIRYNPFTVTEIELNGAIDTLLSDPEVKKNVKIISQEMRQSDCMQKVVERIEYVAKHPKFPTITGIVEHKSL